MRKLVQRTGKRQHKQENITNRNKKNYDYHHVSASTTGMKRILTQYHSQQLPISVSSLQRGGHALSF